MLLSVLYYRNANEPYFINELNRPPDHHDYTVYRESLFNFASNSDN